jgi:TRAP-type uncharacterized transport system fused permease subunit
MPAVLGVYFLATFAIGYFGGPIGWSMRFLMAIAGVLLIHPGIVTDLAGLGIGALVYLSQRLVRRAEEGAQ